MNYEAAHVWWLKLHEPKRVSGDWGTSQGVVGVHVLLNKT